MNKPSFLVFEIGLNVIANIRISERGDYTPNTHLDGLVFQWKAALLLLNRALNIKEWTL